MTPISRHYSALTGATTNASALRSTPFRWRSRSRCAARATWGGGNRIASARLPGPVGISDPAERIAAIRASIRSARDEPALDTVDLLSAGLARPPGWTIASLIGDMTRGNDLQASNVPGIRERVFLAGAEVERMYPYGPLPGCAAMITMITHGDTCCVGVNFDAASFTDPEAFAECLADGFAEVLALNPGASEPVRRF